MVLRQKLKKVSVLLDIGDPDEVNPGVFVTRLTHPSLEGELRFAHSKNVGRDEVLKAVDENIVGQVFDVIDIVGELVNGRNPKAPSTSTSPAREK